MKIWTLDWIADWEGGPYLFATKDAVDEYVKSHAEDVANDSGEPLPTDPADYEQFVRDHGWKVQHFDVAEHTVDLLPLIDIDELECALIDVTDAAAGDSNDTEIQVLQDAVELLVNALATLGVEIPQAEETQ